MQKQIDLYIKSWLFNGLSQQQEIQCFCKKINKITLQVGVGHWQAYNAMRFNGEMLTYIRSLTKSKFVDLVKRKTVCMCVGS